MSSANNDCFTSFQFGCLLFLLLVWLLWLGLPVSYWIRKVKDNNCLVPNLQGNTCSFSPLSVTLTVGFSYMAFIMFRDVLSNPTLLRVFIINGCWFLSNTGFACIYMIMWFLSFILFMWWVTFITLWMLYQPCIPGISPTCSWCMIFFMHCCIWFAIFCWGF